MRTGAREEHDVDDAARPLDRVHEPITLLREVLHDEAGDEEREHRIEVEVAEHLGRTEPERDEHDEELPADELQVRGEDEAERRPDGDAAHDLVAERAERLEREDRVRIHQRARDADRSSEEHDDDDVRGHDEAEGERRQRTLRARLREDAERRRRAARDREDAPQERDADDGCQGHVLRERDHRRRSDHEDGADEEEAEDALDHHRDGEAAEALLQRVDPELASTGQRDQRERERVDRLQSLHRVVIDEVKDVRARDHPGDQIAGEVRDSEHLHELARQRAREEEEAEA